MKSEIWFVIGVCERVTYSYLYPPPPPSFSPKIYKLTQEIPKMKNSSNHSLFGCPKNIKKNF